MSHYTHLNLSPVSQITVQQLFRTIAFIAGMYFTMSSATWFVAKSLKFFVMNYTRGYCLTEVFNVDCQ